MYHGVHTASYITKKCILQGQIECLLLSFLICIEEEEEKGEEEMEKRKEKRKKKKNKKKTKNLFD